MEARYGCLMCDVVAVVVALGFVAEGLTWGSWWSSVAPYGPSREDYSSTSRLLPNQCGRDERECWRYELTACEMTRAFCEVHPYLRRSSP
jgi:hypothetical protein